MRDHEQNYLKFKRWGKDDGFSAEDESGSGMVTKAEALELVEAFFDDRGPDYEAQLEEKKLPDNRAKARMERGMEAK